MDKDPLDYAYATRIVEIIESLIDAKIIHWNAEGDVVGPAEDIVDQWRQELVNVLEELFHD